MQRPCIVNTIHGRGGEGGTYEAHDSISYRALRFLWFSGGDVIPTALIKLPTLGRAVFRDVRMFAWALADVLNDALEIFPYQKRGPDRFLGFQVMVWGFLELSSRSTSIWITSIVKKFIL